MRRFSGSCPCGPMALCVAALSLVLSVGCAGKRSALETLEESLLFFHTHVRSAEIESASSYVAIEAMDKFLKLHDPDRNIYVMEEFSIKQVSGDPSSGQMEVRTTAHVRKKNSITVKTVRYHETWEKREGRWMLVDEELVLPGSGYQPSGKPDVRD